MRHTECGQVAQLMELFPETHSDGIMFTWQYVC